VVLSLKTSQNVRATSSHVETEVVSMRDRGVTGDVTVRTALTNSNVVGFSGFYFYLREGGYWCGVVA